MALALGLAATAGPSAATDRQAPRPTRVLAVGDSVMEGAAAAIPAALPGRDVVVDTEVSRSTARSADAAATHGTDWDAVVVLLGHNDGGTPSAYQPAFVRLFDTFASVPHVIVLTIHEARPYYADVNAFLRDQAVRRPNLEVLDWNAAVNATPGAVAGDGLHLTPAGAQLMARSIAGAVDAAEQASMPTTTTVPPTTVPPTTAAPTSTTGATTTTATTAVPSTSTSAAPAAITHRRRTLRSPARPEPSEPGPHTPAGAWPLVLLGAAVLAAFLVVEQRRRTT